MSYPPPIIQSLFRTSWYRRFVLHLTLGHVQGGNICEGYTLMVVATTTWLTGLWSTQAKVEGIMLRTA